MDTDETNNIIQFPVDKRGPETDLIDFEDIRDILEDLAGHLAAKEGQVLEHHRTLVSSFALTLRLIASDIDVIAASEREAGRDEDGNDG
jgi:DNA-directed RNA polymerase sigma subunit (sigma70/sigma32)